MRVRATTSTRTLKSFREFCGNTSLHGFRYLVQQKLDKTQRCYFAVSIVCAFLTSMYFIYLVYYKWQTTPVLSASNPKPSYIFMEPFPAVTVCNMNQAVKSRVLSLSKKSQEYAIVKLLCRNGSRTDLQRNIRDWSLIKTTILNISQPCADMLISCTFGSRKYPCYELFHTTLTDEGLCCSFNMIHPSYMYKSSQHLQRDNLFSSKLIPLNWYAERGYPVPLPEMYFPRKPVGVGMSHGLSLLLDVQHDENYCLSSYSYGFKIAAHRPDEIPNVRETGVYIAPGEEQQIRLTQNKVQTSNEVRAMPIKDRKCLFQEESALKLFAHYTERNCVMECKSLSYFNLCGCLTFYVPQIYPNATVCNAQQMSCLGRAHRDNNNTCLAACLPGCNDLTFTLNMFSAPLAVRVSRILRNFSQSYARRNLAVVHIYYQNRRIKTELRNEFNDLSNLLANVGGLMSLFMGFSLMFPVELIYYAFIYPMRRRQMTANVIAVEFPHYRNKQRNTMNRHFYERQKGNLMRMYRKRNETMRKRPIYVNDMGV